MEPSIVLAMIGAPLGETWRYEAGGPATPSLVAFGPDGSTDRLSDSAGADIPIPLELMDKDAVRSVLGDPATITWTYSAKGIDGSYRERFVVFKEGRVHYLRPEYRID
jgi:hypothetical protein